MARTDGARPRPVDIEKDTVRVDGIGDRDSRARFERFEQERERDSRERFKRETRERERERFERESEGKRKRGGFEAPSKLYAKEGWCDFLDHMSVVAC